VSLSRAGSLEPREGEARGIELFASTDPQGGKVRWFGSYTYGSVEDRIDGRMVTVHAAAARAASDPHR
jgi:hypothetical protein